VLQGVDQSTRVELVHALDFAYGLLGEIPQSHIIHAGPTGQLLDELDLFR
jgi:hypothetical protein